MESDIDILAIESMRDDFRQRWENGERPKIETVLPEFEGSPWRLMLTMLVCIEVRVRRKLGEFPRQDEYQQRFPGLAAYIRLAFGQRSVPHLFPIEWMRWFLRTPASVSD